jgi:hypothetical protein
VLEAPFEDGRLEDTSRREEGHNEGIPNNCLVILVEIFREEYTHGSTSDKDLESSTIASWEVLPSKICSTILDFSVS